MKYGLWVFGLIAASVLVFIVSEIALDHERNFRMKCYAEMKAKNADEIARVCGVLR